MAATERIHGQRAIHGTGAPIQSSSVPSTPHQHPRDLRFPSRSPSPGRGLNRRSPHTTVTQPQATSIPQQTQPVVCKFETGAEFRKRRIPYKDGGNDPLPPPKDEPKKILEPHEEDKLSGDMRELYDRLLPSDESEERRAKLIKKLEKILNDEWPGNDIKVNVFGSSGNLLSSSDSDGGLYPRSVRLMTSLISSSGYLYYYLIQETGVYAQSGHCLASTYVGASHQHIQC